MQQVGQHEGRSLMGSEGKIQVTPGYLSLVSRLENNLSRSDQRLERPGNKETNKSERSPKMFIFDLMNLLVLC